MSLVKATKKKPADKASAELENAEHNSDKASIKTVSAPAAVAVKKSKPAPALVAAADKPKSVVTSDAPSDKPRHAPGPDAKVDKPKLAPAKAAGKPESAAVQVKAADKPKSASIEADATEDKPKQTPNKAAAANIANSDTVSATAETSWPTSAKAAVTADKPKIAPAETASADSTSSEKQPEEQALGFRALNLSEPTMRAVIEAGFEAPTPIQAQAIPVLLAGRDLIGQAQTGTGKTAAFALPLAEILDPTQNYPQAIILLPTRELCIQVAQETHNLTKYKRYRVVPVYGGQPIDRQFRALQQGAQIVVGTPGRVLDHLRRGTLNLGRVKMVILDEADEMLNMGFLEDVEEILKGAPEERQTALFSATMPPRIAALAKTYLKNAERVAIESKRRTVAEVEQTYYEVIPSQKMEALARILDMESPGSTIIFCRTRREVDELGESLQMRGYEAETLHGEMNQAARDRVMNRFRTSQADLLIATDVAARGLDIDQVTHVINYDIPWDVESYIHRIGRTGRAGRSGEAITLISPRERYQLRQIERYINAPIKPARVPSAADIATRRREVFKDKLRQTLTDGNSDGYLVTIEELTEEGDYDAAQIAAAALQMLWQAQKGAGEYDIAESSIAEERAEAGMTRLFLQIGRQDGIRPGDIVGAIANEAGVPGNAIGAIDIMDHSAFVEVPESAAARIIEALTRTKIRGKKIAVEIARPRRESDAVNNEGPRPGGNRDFGGPNRGRDDRGPRPQRGGPPGRPQETYGRRSRY